MEFIKETVRRRTFAEWFQPANLLNTLLEQIVHSKRLLADHIELLEQCHVIPIDAIESSTGKKYTIQFMGGLVLSSLAVASMKTDINSLRFFVSTAATTYGLFLSVEAIFVVKHKLTQHRLNETLSCIDRVDTAIRKNISFFRESKFLGDATIFDKFNRSEICMKSISEMIRIIYDEVKMLESIQLPKHIESMYEPLEELSSCIYFEKNIQEFSTDDIKAFYNIFLYFQSQYLTRLCLIIYYDREYGLNYINDGNVQFRTNLCMWLDKCVQQITIKTRPDAYRHENAMTKDVDSVDLVKMKRSSVDILCRLIAITNQYQCTDECIQSLDINTNEKQMVAILNEMKRIKDSLVACQDDFETLKLIYNKCIAKKFQLSIEHEETIEMETVPPINNTKPNNQHENINMDEESKEYFAMRDIKNDDDTESDDENLNVKSNRSKWSDELDAIDMKVTRSFFAPVLKQLKNKIDPIKDEMKEREMKFLMSKGVDREKIIEFDKNEDEKHHGIDDSDGESGSECDSDDMPIKHRPKPSQNRFDEMRAFLEQKQPIRFMPFGNLPPPSGSEEVLE